MNHILKQLVEAVEKHNELIEKHNELQREQLEYLAEIKYELQGIKRNI